MSKLYVIGIGGSGARVLRSAVMMAAAGVDVSNVEIVPVIIDPDVSNADLTKTVLLLNKYVSIRSNISFATGQTQTFFKTPITKVLQNYTLGIQDVGDRPFREFVSIAGMSRENQAMMKMLFSKNNLDARMDVGFKGNPNIGTVALNQVVYSDGFKAFANSFEQGDKIFIISSIFGGTGASGFPLLVKTLANGNGKFPNADLISKAEMGALSVLPYFKLEQSENSEIDSASFISKAKSALAYYEADVRKYLNSFYFIGDESSAIYENHEGGVLQKNKAHLVEFLSATALVDFAARSHANREECLELGIRDDVGDVSFNSFYDGLLRMLAKPMIGFALMERCLSVEYDFVSSLRLNANTTGGWDEDFYHSAFMTQLKSFLSDYRQWLEEMQENRRSLKLFDFTCGKKPFNLVVGMPPKKSGVFEKKDYTLFFAQLNKVAKQCHGEKPSKFLEMYSRATESLISKKFNL